MVDNKDKSIKNKKSIPKSAREEFERKKLLRKQAKKRVRIRNFTISIITLLIVIIGVPIFLVGSFITSLDNGDLIKGVAPAKDQSVNILVLGLDSGDVINTENTNSKKTDTIMVFNYSPSTKKINLVSIPRDTLIEVDAYDGFGNLRHYWKINVAEVLGGDEEIIYHIENLLETDINYMVKVNYEAFRNFIDAIGGIEMYIEQDMFYDDNTQDLHINFTGGETVLLDGEKAEKFFRWRGNNDGTGLAEGDLGRIKNQQSFIKEVMKKCLNPSIIFKIPKILDVLKADIATNMPASKMISYGFKVLFNEGISMSTLEGYPEMLYDESFLVVEKDTNREILNSLKNGEVLEEESSRTDYNILVLNGTRINGLAGTLKDNMESIGYNSIEVGNSGKQDKSVIICENKELREQLKMDIGISKFKKNKNDKYADYDAVIIIGEDVNIE